MPMRGELPEVTARPYPRPAVTGNRTESRWSRLAAALTDPDMHFVLALGLIGVLVTLNAVLLCPDFGGTVAQLALFP